jgi:hypothetical protein
MMESKKGARYDLGLYNNIKATLGNNPFTWCIPGCIIYIYIYIYIYKIDPNTSEDGVSYQ